MSLTQKSISLFLSKNRVFCVNRTASLRILTKPNKNTFKFEIKNDRSLIKSDSSVITQKHIHISNSSKLPLKFPIVVGVYFAKKIFKLGAILLGRYKNYYY